MTTADETANALRSMNGASRNVDQPIVGIQTVPAKVKGRSATALLVLGACSVCLGYALFTDHIWEDFFIIFRHSQNLCEGKGLVYNPPERVHGYTSPVGVLLPALFYFLTGESSYVPAVWMFRIVNMLAFAAGGVLLVRSYRRAGGGVGRYAAVFFAILYILESKSVVFSMSCMETPFLLLFLAWSIDVFVRDASRHWLEGGLAWAGIMWTRPDGCVYIAALSLGMLLFTSGSRWRLLAGLVKSGLVCALVYAPWFVWAWRYYGSPVPHSILAKANMEDGPLAQFYWGMNRITERFPQVTAEIFQPIYFFDGKGWLPGDGWRLALLAYTYALGLFSAFYWILPLNDRLGRFASFCFALLCFYLSFIACIFPWYSAPPTMLGLVVISRGLFALAEASRRIFSPEDVARSRRLAIGLLGLIVAVQAGLFGLISWEMRIQEAEIEMAHRREIGLWLKDRVKPEDRVYLEPLGYIGYFSQAHMVDWPGIVSPQVVKLRREKHASLVTIITDLQPEWMVLRPKELDALVHSEANDFFETNYHLARDFDATSRLNTYTFLPGKPYLLYDADLRVYQRRPVVTMPSPKPSPEL